MAAASVDTANRVIIKEEAIQTTSTGPKRFRLTARHRKGKREDASSDSSSEEDEPGPASKDSHTAVQTVSGSKSSEEPVAEMSESVFGRTAQPAAIVRVLRKDMWKRAECQTEKAQSMPSTAALPKFQHCSIGNQSQSLPEKQKSNSIQHLTAIGGSQAARPVAALPSKSALRVARVSFNLRALSSAKTATVSHIVDSADAHRAWHPDLEAIKSIAGTVCP